MTDLRPLGMNKIRRTLIFAAATLLITLLLMGCRTAATPTPSVVPTIAPTTPVTSVDVQPSPVVEQPTEVEQPPEVEEPTEVVGEVGAEAETEEVTPSPDEEWIQETFGDAWTIAYPAGWVVNRAGAHEGALFLEGEYGGHSYAVSFTYPIGILVQTLDEWLAEILGPLTPEQRDLIVVSDLMVADTPAKKVLNVPNPADESLSHHLYLWRSETKNPRLVTITQTDNQELDPVAMEQLLDRFVSTIQ